MTRTWDKQVLQSGGMVYVNATSNGQQLALGKDKEIGVMLPNADVQTDMSIYEGEQTDSGMVWNKTPDMVLNESVETLEREYIVVRFYQTNSETETPEQAQQLSDWLWEEGRKPGDTITIGLCEIEVISFSYNTEALGKTGYTTFAQDVVVNKGKNGYVEDFNTNYIFSIKKLGWANLDRLFEDDRSQEVKFAIEVENRDEFNYVFTSLIVPEYNIYIPGYQRVDGSYSFTHDDREPTQLPIGAEVIILATAYKGTEPYFALIKLPVKSEQKILFTLLPTDMKTLREKLEKEL